MYSEMRDDFKILEEISNGRHIVELGKGKEGICYRIGNKTYKLYNEFYCNIFSCDSYASELIKFKNLYINNIYFIRELIYDNDLIIGSVCDYANGVSCAKTQLHRRKIDSLVKALDSLKNSILELSKLGIYIDDSFLANILYDGKYFKLIDTGSYYYSNQILNINDDVNMIYKSNMKLIMKNLFVNITNKYCELDNFIFVFLWYIDSPYKYYLVDNDLMMEPDKTIIGIKEILQEYIGYEISNFSQCRNDLLKIRKKK